jgi:antitoxin (DNA-binding transcriptional repressor) of toxin-antitoxin stability system
MESVSIRGLRGADLAERARRGRPIAITNHRVLIGVMIPVSSAWVEQLVYDNWARVRQRIAEGERAIADTMATSAPGGAGSEASASAPGGQPDQYAPAWPFAAAVVGGDSVVQSRASEEAVDRLRVALNPGRHAVGQPENGQHENGPVESSVVRIRIGDLSAAQIEKAGLNGQTLAVTHDRKLIGIIIPVTRDLVHFLIEQSISSVISNIQQGEDQLKSEER